MIVGKPLSKYYSDLLPNATQYIIIVDALQYYILIELEINYTMNKLFQFLHCHTNIH